MDTKTCKDCGKTKPATEFSPGGKRADGTRYLHIYCKPCFSERSMQYRDKNPDTILNAHLKRNFGITLDEFNAIAEEQGGVCAICGEPPRIVMGVRSRRQGRAVRPRLVVDHCHETGRVRGLLCTPCNRAIGYLRDNPDYARFAAEYLEERA